MSSMSDDLEQAIGRLILMGDANNSSNAVMGHYLNVSQGTTTGHNLWFGLLTAMASPEDGGYTEPNPASNYSGYTRIEYARSISNWTSSFNSVPSDSDPVKFTNAAEIRFPTCTGAFSGAVIKYVGIFDASTNGNLLFYSPLIPSGADWKIAACIDSAADTFQSAGHGLSDNDAVCVYAPYDGLDAGATSVLPSGLTAGTTYYIFNKSTDTFQLDDVNPATAALAIGKGGMLYIKTTSITVTASSIPSIPIGGCVIKFA